MFLTQSRKEAKARSNNEYKMKRAKGLTGPLFFSFAFLIEDMRAVYHGCRRFLVRQDFYWKQNKFAADFDSRYRAASELAADVVVDGTPG
jgi:hypothetical protein